MIILLIYIGIIAYWIYSLTKWDGKRHCDHDCEHCSFPPCNIERRNQNEQGNNQKVD